jgi:hypothetical protein
MPTGLVKNAADETKWKRAKRAAQKSTGKKSWALVNYIYQKMKKGVSDNIENDNAVAWTATGRLAKIFKPEKLNDYVESQTRGDIVGVSDNPVRLHPLIRDKIIQYLSQAKNVQGNIIRKKPEIFKVPHGTLSQNTLSKSVPISYIIKQINQEGGIDRLIKLGKLKHYNQGRYRDVYEWTNRRGEADPDKVIKIERRPQGANENEFSTWKKLQEIERTELVPKIYQRFQTPKGEDVIIAKKAEPFTLKTMPSESNALFRRLLPRDNKRSNFGIMKHGRVVKLDTSHDWADTINKGTPIKHIIRMIEKRGIGGLIENGTLEELGSGYSRNAYGYKGNPDVVIKHEPNPWPVSSNRREGMVYDALKRIGKTHLVPKIYANIQLPERQGDVLITKRAKPFKYSRSKELTSLMDDPNHLSTYKEIKKLMPFDNKDANFGTMGEGNKKRLVKLDTGDDPAHLIKQPSIFKAVPIAHIIRMINKEGISNLINNGTLEEIGSGGSRYVFKHKGNPHVVIKHEPEGNAFSSNAYETAIFKKLQQLGSESSFVPKVYTNQSIPKDKGGGTVLIAKRAIPYYDQYHSWTYSDPEEQAEDDRFSYEVDKIKNLLPADTSPQNFGIMGQDKHRRVVKLDTGNDRLDELNTKVKFKELKKRKEEFRSIFKAVPYKHILRMLAKYGIEGMRDKGWKIDSLVGGSYRKVFDLKIPGKEAPNVVIKMPRNPEDPTDWEANEEEAKAWKMLKPKEEQYLMAPVRGHEAPFLLMDKVIPLSKLVNVQSKILRRDPKYYKDYKKILERQPDDSAYRNLGVRKTKGETKQLVMLDANLFPTQYEWFQNKQDILKALSNKTVKESGDKINIDWKKYSIKQLKEGMEIEAEHGSTDPQTDVTHDDPVLTAKIALAHIKESPEYYKELKKMEKTLEKAKGFAPTGDPKDLFAGNKGRILSQNYTGDDRWNPNSMYEINKPGLPGRYTETEEPDSISKSINDISRTQNLFEGKSPLNETVIKRKQEHYSQKQPNIDSSDWPIYHHLKNESDLWQLAHNDFHNFGGINVRPNEIKAGMNEILYLTHAPHLVNSNFEPRPVSIIMNPNTIKKKSVWIPKDSYEYIEDPLDFSNKSKFNKESLRQDMYGGPLRKEHLQRIAQRYPDKLNLWATNDPENNPIEWSDIDEGHITKDLNTNDVLGVIHRVHRGNASQGGVAQMRTSAKLLSRRGIPYYIINGSFLSDRLRKEDVEDLESLGATFVNEKDAHQIARQLTKQSIGKLQKAVPDPLSSTPVEEIDTSAEHLDPEFREMILELIDRAKRELGLDVYIREGFRSRNRQQWLNDLVNAVGYGYAPSIYLENGQVDLRDIEFPHGAGLAADLGIRNLPDEREAHHTLHALFYSLFKDKVNPETLKDDENHYEASKEFIQQKERDLSNSNEYTKFASRFEKAKVGRKGRSLEETDWPYYALEPWKINKYPNTPETKSKIWRTNADRLMRHLLENKFSPEQIEKMFGEKNVHQSYRDAWKQGWGVDLKLNQNKTGDWEYSFSHPAKGLKQTFGDEPEKPSEGLEAYDFDLSNPPTNPEALSHEEPNAKKYTDYINETIQMIDKPKFKGFMGDVEQAARTYAKPLTDLAGVIGGTASYLKDKMGIESTPQNQSVLEEPQEETPKISNRFDPTGNQIENKISRQIEESEKRVKGYEAAPGLQVRKKINKIVPPTKTRGVTENVINKREKEFEKRSPEMLSRIQETAGLMHKKNEAKKEIVSAMNEEIDPSKIQKDVEDLAAGKKDQIGIGKAASIRFLYKALYRED